MVDGLTLGLQIVCVIILFMIAALCSGLNLGLLGIVDLRILTLKEAGTDLDKRRVKRVEPLLQDRHLVLVSILIIGAICMEILPMLLDSLVGPTVALIISVTGILLLSEILPQAVFSRYSLQISAALSPFVWVMIFCTFVISYPLARFLDVIVGKHDTEYYRREELKTLITLHGKGQYNQALTDHFASMLTDRTIDAYGSRLERSSNENSDSRHSRLTPASSSSSSDPHQHTHPKHKDTGEGARELDLPEVTIIRGALDASNATIGDIYTELSKVFMLEVNTVLDERVMTSIAAHGHSRIPIYKDERSNVVGILYTKELITVSPGSAKKVSDLDFRQAQRVTLRSHIYPVLDFFQTGRAHLALVVSHETGGIFGIVTLEDILEKIIGEPIYDEADHDRMQLRSESKLFDNGQVIVLTPSVSQRSLM